MCSIFRDTAVCLSFSWGCVIARECLNAAALQTSNKTRIRRSNQSYFKMSNFNADARGKRPDSLGSLDSETLTTDAGEHGWRKGPAKKPSPLESLAHEEGNLDEQPTSQEFTFPPRHHGDEDDKGSPPPVAMDHLTLGESSAGASNTQDQEEFAEIASQNLKEHFGRLQATHSTEAQLSMSKVSSVTLYNTMGACLWNIVLCKRNY